eukprot:TRINITY_DN6373_c0_g1_i1.p1 TRINITY_DN6373_c0_g1~~TRINITY_DN6373_c0_g1_i1.p1  ORF type:complete len:407 (+),score=67.75 TRINITY_DN6373_c0_g1_i1:79-1299(+)
MGCCESAAAKPVHRRDTKVPSRVSSDSGVADYLEKLALHDFVRDYEVFEEVGEGEFGIVVRCRKRGDPSAEYAAKVLAKDSCVKRMQILSEKKGASIDPHTNVMRLTKIYDSDDAAVLIYEYFSGGEVSYTLGGRTYYSEETVGIIIKGLVKAVNHLHKQNLAHLDIKPQNILLQKRCKTDSLIKVSDIKLIDFGSLTTFTPNKKDIKTIAGTPFFAAPEIISVFKMGSSVNMLPFDERCDIWSVGVVAYVLLTGRHPFVKGLAMPQLKMCDAIIFAPLQLPASLSPECRDFLQCCLQKDFTNRPKSSTLTHHPWLTNQPDEETHGQATPISAPVISGERLAYLTSHMSLISAATSLRGLSRFGSVRGGTGLVRKPKDLPNVNAVPEVCSEALSEEDEERAASPEA